MKEQVVVDQNVPLPVINLTGRVRYYVKNGHALYWSTFFILIFIEFFLGGRLSEILTGENYSIYVNVLNNLPFYTVLANIGLSYGIIYIIAYNNSIKYQLLGQTIKLQTVWYLMLVAVHAVIFLFINSVYVQSLLITIIITYSYTYRLNITSFFLATRAYNKAAVANVLQKGVLLLAFLLMFKGERARQFFNNRFGVLYPLIELTVILLYFFVFMHTNTQAFRAAGINYRKRLLKYGKYATFNNGLNVLYYTIMAVIIRSSGIDLHLQIILGLCIIFFRYTGVAIAPIFSVMNPVVTSIKNDAAKVRKTYKKYFAAVLIMSLFVLAACRFFFGYIIARFYADAYHDLPVYFYFFAYLAPLLFLSSLNASFLAALGKIKYTFMAEAVCTVVLLLFAGYNFLSPVLNYRVFYYFVLVHLVLKFGMLSYGAYQAMKK